MCTVKKAVYGMAVLCTLALLIYSYNLWSLGITHANSLQLPECQGKPVYMTTMLIMSGVDTVITLVIPSILLIILNSCIIVKLYVYHNVRHSLRMDFSSTRSKSRLGSLATETVGSDLDSTQNGEYLLTNLNETRETSDVDTQSQRSNSVLITNGAGHNRLRSRTSFPNVTRSSPSRSELGTTSTLKQPDHSSLCPQCFCC